MEGKWKVGDKCMAPFSGDESLYKAVIRKIAEDVDGNKMAEVWYKGYSDDDNELVQIDDLKEIPRFKKSCEKSSSKDTDFESPLFNYISEDDRIRAQYADMYDDPRPVSRPTCSTGAGKKTISPKAKGSKVTAAGKKRKGTVAFGGDVKASQKAAMVNKPRKASPPIVSSSNVDVPSREEWNIADLEEGFSAKDVEKPYFPGKSNISPTEPLMLSGSDKKPLMHVPGTINRYLREYQRDGIRFLYNHYKNDNGAILGDDMGLGKTVQVIAFIAAVLGMTGGREDLERRLPEFLQKESPQKPGSRPKTFLIICPNSVLYNWLDEFETWTHCIVARYHGKERDDTLRRARRGRLDAVLTTYETYRLYLDDLLTVSWDAVFVDEVHKIKEPTALITQALKDINTNKRYGLTGTALQNKMGELWCVLDWANPGCLGGWREFKQEYEQIIKTGQKYNASKRELADARQVAKRFALLRSKWMIRRTKALIAHQLPSKDEHVAFCNLSSFQLDVYRALLESEDMKLVLEQKNPCDCRSGLKRGRCCYKRNDRGEGITSLTFGLMSLLIKVSNHIALLMPDVSKSEKQREKARRYCEIAFAKQPQFVDLSREARFATLSDPTYCGKMQVLEKLLRVFKRENSKVLLFSFYTQLLDILEMFMKTTSYTYRRLDGKTPAQDRQKFVHEFNKDPDIFLFLISTKAGGIGLNLTGANVVVIFDPNWNPTYDLQAQDRAYRIGQHRDVRVYRLISRGSIEENMYLRQLYKQQLASVAVTTENAKRYFTAVAGDREQQGEIFGLHNLFALRGDGSCLTKDVIQREEKTELGITMAKYKPQTSVEEKAKDLLEELLEEEERDDKTREVGEEGEDDDDDDDDMHGMASQLPEVNDEEDDDDGCIHSNSSEMEEVEGRMNSKKLSPEKSRMRSALTKSANNQDYRDDTDEDEGDEWKGQLRKLVRGKAILGKDGQPVQKVKGQRRGGAQSNSLHNNQRVSQTSARVEEEEEEEEDGKETREEKGQREKKEDAGTYRGHKIHRMDSGSIKTAEDVFKTCGIEYVHSNMKVVGASHIEDHVSKVAQRDVFEIGQFSQEPAYCQVPTLDMETVTSNRKPKTTQRKTPSLPRVQSQATSHRLGETTLLVGQTPVGVRRDQFKDMASVLDFSSPSDLASHIQGLSNEACLKLLLSYHQAKYGMDFKEFLKLPVKPSIDPKLARNTRADRGRGEKRESELDETRSRGRGRGRRRDSGAKRRVASRSRKASVGLSSSGDDSFHIDSDDMEGTHGSVGKSVIRTKSVKQEREKENLKERRKRIGGGMISHEVYKEIFDEDSSDGLDASYDDAKIQRTGAGNGHTDFSVQENARKCNQSVRSTDKGNDDVKNVVCDPHRKHKTLQEESKGDASSTARPKREDSLSFLDDIFLSDSGTPRRRPPPKKHVARRDKAIITTTSESDSIFGAESITDDSSGLLSCSVVGKDTDCGDRATTGSGIFTRSNLTLETDIVMETIDGEDRDLWKRNDTFLPRHTFFEETEDSEDSESMFVANPMFKSESGAIT